VAPSPDPLSNPYAPPAVEPAEAHAPRRSSRSSYDSEHRSVGLVILLSLVTLGLYPAIWYVRRAPFLDSLDADKKVGQLPWIALLGVVASFGVSLAQAPDAVRQAVQLGGGIFNLFLAFRVANVLRSDFARSGRLLDVSTLAVFFFGCFYLQHVMNRAAGTPARVRRKRKRSTPAGTPGGAASTSAEAVPKVDR